jgi:hypothetical protein
MHTSDCYSCGSPLATDDNFCRRCGTSMHAQVPAVRAEMTPAVWRPNMPPVVKGAAVMAAGTIAQYVFRRMVSGLLNAGTRKPRRFVGWPRGGDGMVDEAQIITETVMLRRVRVRRQA